MVYVKIPKRGRASIKVAIALYLEDAIALLIFYRAIIFLFRRCDRPFFPKVRSPFPNLPHV
ncbi:hypothetical protein [Planktothrix paucivesiculata]|uniref:hypothetical protein n=1 Tax=Planktothrix paucivesiculata TaxID=1678308 RepID=UPI0012DC5C3C|nr:hypothetical protein [Planktothrix paucivesiculata]